MISISERVAQAYHYYADKKEILSGRSSRYPRFSRLVITRMCFDYGDAMEEGVLQHPFLMDVVSRERTF